MHPICALQMCPSRCLWTRTLQPALVAESPLEIPFLWDFENILTVLPLVVHCTTACCDN